MSKTVRTIMLVDVADFTVISETGSRRHILNLVESIKATMGGTIVEKGGEILKEIGDALLISFTTPSSALEAAIEIQKKNRIRNTQVSPSERFQIRIVINTGAISITKVDAHGDMIQILHMMEQAVDTDQIVISDATYLALPSQKINATPILARKIKRGKFTTRLYRVINDSSENINRENRESSFQFKTALIHDRLLAGILDLWLGVFAVIGLQLVLNYQGVIDCTKIYRVNLQLHGESTEQSTQKKRMLFDGPEGQYDIAAIFTTAQDSAAKLHFDINSTKYSVPLIWDRPAQQIELVAQNQSIDRTSTVLLPSSSSTQNASLDFLDFIPSKSRAPRPKGNQEYSFYWYLLAIINLNQISPGAFLLKSLQFSLLICFLSYLLFSSTPGGLSLKLSTQQAYSGKRINALQALLRTALVVLVPFGGWPALSKERTFADRISSTRVVKRIVRE